MGVRPIILRLLLGSLAAAAAAGVFAVLLPIRDVPWRVSWTGLATAGAAALLIPLTFLIDRARARMTGLLGMCLVVAMFLIVFALIWLPNTVRWRHDEHLGITLLLLLLHGPLGMGAVFLLGAARARVAAIAAIAALAVSFGLVVAAVWAEDDQLGGTGFVIGGWGLVAAALLVGVPAGRPWRWVGIVGTFVGAVVVVSDIWNRRWSNEDVATIATSVGCLLAFVNLITLAPLRPGQGWLRWGTIAAATATTALIDVLIVGDGWFAEDLFARGAAAGGIVTACGSMALLVLVALNRRGDADARSVGAMTISIVCPRCDEGQELPLGSSRCRACGLRFKIRAEEPVCRECGYLLHGLASERCPECGAAVREGEA